MNRYQDRKRYFNELAQTSREFYIDYVSGFCPDGIAGKSVLEIGCGEGGNLLPFAECGCHVKGIDLASRKIENAMKFFAERNAHGDFSCADFLADKSIEEKFDIILIHDVVEHIEPDSKPLFFRRTAELLRQGGIVFFGFPAWQMPFGGHQQICRSRACRIPFIHLLPLCLYRGWLRLWKEDPAKVDELLGIRRSRMTPERFEKLSGGAGFKIVDRQFWLISPHYKVKFGLKPRKLWKWVERLHGIRNFFISTCIYIVSENYE